MMLCERDESVQRECSRTRKNAVFSAILKRGPKGLFSGSAVKTYRELDVLGWS